jgi:LCP family protein required for cell wall assembly
MNDGAQPPSPERSWERAISTWPTPSRPERRSRWSQRRKVFLLLAALLVLIPLVSAGWYAWRIANAIDDVQYVAVVDLPERSEPLDGRGDQQPASGTPQVSTASDPTAAANDPSSFDIARGIISTGTGVNAKSPQDVWPRKDAITILVLGVDTRADGGDQNADVIILARLNLVDRTMHSVSIPRDLLVDIPGHGEGKINGAYNIGVTEHPDSRVAGVAKMRDTIEYNFGIPIDDYVMIDFNGFEKVIDSVGGIDITVPEAIHDTEYPTEDYGITTLDIPAGHQHMDGETALAYARTRHGDNDDARRDRQIMVIEALFEKGQRIGSLTKIVNLILAVGDTVQTSFHFDEQLALASMALNMDERQIDMTSVNQPMIQPGTAADGAWVYVGDLQEISAFIEGTLEGDSAGADDGSAGS